jgi:hypothetical protein
MAAAPVTAYMVGNPVARPVRPEPRRNGWPVCDAQGLRPANARICRNEYFIRAQIYAQTGILTLALSNPFVR